VATGCNIGCSVIISQLFGGKKFAHLKTAVSTSLVSVLVLSIFMTVVGRLACPLLMQLLQTPANIFADAEIYLNIYVYGLVFLFVYNVCNGIFVALGDSKTPLIFLIFSSVSNIVLDIAFVVVFKRGVDGIAFATFLCQGIAALLSIITLFVKLHKIKTEKYKKFSWDMLGKISIVAIPSILQQSFISVGNLFIQGIVNSFGSKVIAGYAAAVKLNTFGIMSFSTLGNALSSFCAQNLGAGKAERVHEGFKSALAITSIIVLPLSIVYVAFAPQLMGLFVGSGNTAVIQAGSLFLRTIAPFYIIVAVKLLIDGVLRGGSAMTAFMVATFSDLILRVVLSYVFIGYVNTPLSIWVSWPIGWIIATLFSVYFYKKGVWKKRILYNEQYIYLH
ncbi:MAG: MATE family efflux transporter, partial [Oscillospiraceae bacterium]